MALVSEAVGELGIEAVRRAIAHLPRMIADGEVPKVADQATRLSA